MAIRLSIDAEPAPADFVVLAHTLRCAVRFSYRDADNQVTRRIATPLAIGRTDGFFGHCHLREEPRRFKFLQMWMVEICADPDWMPEGWREPDPEFARALDNGLGRA